MEKRELQSLVKKRSVKETEVVSVRVDTRIMDKVRAKEIDVAGTIKAVLERISE